LVLDGETAPETLMQIVKATLKANPNNSVIGFKDNSSAIRQEPSPLSFFFAPSLTVLFIVRKKLFHASQESAISLPAHMQGFYDIFRQAKEGQVVLVYVRAAHAFD